jgi:glycosyltransferase involved in cell wall biosynthesis
MSGVSVLIPSYNSSSYIEATLLSLSAQTSKNFEAIIVDDHSTDDTFAVAENYLKNSGLKGFIYRRPDSLPKGVSNCRNFAIKNANYDWVCFLDSDDLLMPQKIEGTIKLIEQYGESVHAFMHNCRLFEDESNKTISFSNTCPESGPQEMLDKLLNFNNIVTSSVTIKKSLIEEIGYFDDALHGIEDYMMWLRVSKRTKWCYSKEIWTEYRVRKQSLMGGRPINYYVVQNVNLIKCAAKLPEFKPEELEKLKQYLMFRNMQYYAIESINRFGLKDFLAGIRGLLRYGYFQEAFFLMYKHAKANLLQNMSRFKRSLEFGTRKV